MQKEGMKNIVKSLGIKEDPTVVLMHKGKVIDRFTGLDDAKLDRLLSKVDELVK